MEQTLDCNYTFFSELRTAPDLAGRPLSHETIGGDLGALVDEAFVSGILAEQLPAAPDSVHVAVEPVWSNEPIAKSIAVRIEAESNGKRHVHECKFDRGGWVRRATGHVTQLREEGTVSDEDTVYPVILAEPEGNGSSLSETTAESGNKTAVAPLHSPTIVEQSLEDFGVRCLGSGSLVPDRPVLVNNRMVDEILRVTEEASIAETGGAALGKMIRLARPLPGTHTRIVTILSAIVVDQRHAGEVVRVTFSPEALAEADEIAHTRGAGESVLTVFHSHGWGTGCGNCNQSEHCGLPECTRLSLDDYTVLESLFPGKATVMPIAGRKFGAPGQRPVLELHAWRGGAMRPIRWQTYED